MRTANISLREIFNEIPREKREETRLSFAISNRLDTLMREKGLNKKQFAETLAMLSSFFGQPIVTVE